MLPLSEQAVRLGNYARRIEGLEHPLKWHWIQKIIFYWLVFRNEYHLLWVEQNTTNLCAETYCPPVTAWASLVFPSLHVAGTMRNVTSSRSVRDTQCIRSLTVYSLWRLMDPVTDLILNVMYLRCSRWMARKPHQCLCTRTRLCQSEKTYLRRCQIMTKYSWRAWVKIHRVPQSQSSQRSTIQSWQSCYVRGSPSDFFKRKKYPLARSDHCFCCSQLGFGELQTRDFFKARWLSAHFVVDDQFTETLDLDLLAVVLENFTL